MIPPNCSHQEFHLLAVHRQASRTLAAACGLVLAISPLNGQSASSAAADGDEVVELEAFEVEGFREGLARAREQQREAANLKDIISVDTVGKLPDSNVAEALQRVPGVYVDSSQGEGRYVSIRGVDPNLNNVTMNGMTMAVSDVDGRSGRAAPLDVLSSSALSSVEIIKTPTPDMDGQGLGGTININTPSAFDRQGTFIYGSLKGGFNDQRSGLTNQEADLNFGLQFGSEKQFGVMIGVNTFRREFYSFDVAAEAYQVLGDTAGEYFGVDGTPNPFGQIVVPARMSLFATDGKRTREGINLNLEWRSSEDEPGTELWLRGYHAKLEEENFNPHLRLRTSNLNRARTVFTSPSTGFTTLARVETETTQEAIERPVDQLVLGGRHTLGEDWTVEGNLTYTTAREDKRASLYADEFRAENFRNGLGNVPENAAFTFDFSGFWPVFQTAFDDPVSGWPGTGDIGDPSFYPFFRIRNEFSEVEEETKTFDLNLRHDQPLAGLPGYWKIGVKYLDRGKFVDDKSMRYSPNETIFLSEFFEDGSNRLPYGVQTANAIAAFPLGPQTGPYAGIYSRQLGVTHNPEAWEAAFGKFVGRALDEQYDPLTGTPDPASLIKDPAVWTFDEAGSRANSFEDDFKLSEEITSIFLMGEYDVTDTMVVVAGVRLEDTKAELEGNILQDDRVGGSFDVIPTGLVKKSFTNVLPNAQLRWEVSPDVLVRAALTTTVGRPDYTFMTPTARQFQVNSGSTAETNSGSLQVGNPLLEPYEATNFDLSAAYYLPENRGIIMISAFYKKVKNPIYGFNYNAVTDTDVDLAGTGIERTTLNGMPVVTYQGFTFDSLSVSTRENADDGEIQGLELTYQQDFHFLPAPFDGFGASINLTWIDSEVTLFDRPVEKTPFFRQPDFITNAQLYYQMRGFEARLAWHFQDDALGVIGTDPLIDQYSRSREQWDARVSYRLNPNWSIFAEGKNLTNEPYRTYMGYSRDSLGGAGNAFPGYLEVGQSYFAGISFNFGN